MHRTALARTSRKVLTATAIAAAVTGFSFAGAGTASATTLAAQSCTSSVTGQIGDQVAVTGPSMKGLVKTAAREAVTMWNFLTVHPDSIAREVEKKATINVGKIPDASSGKIAGEAVGTAVAQALKDSPGLGLLDSTKQQTLDHIKKKVSGSCGLTVFAANHQKPTSQQPAPRGSQAPTTGNAENNTGGTGGNGANSGTGSLPYTGTGDARAPQRDYSGIPTATAGIAVPPDLRYPPSNGVPGQTSPEFGILGAEGSEGLGETGQPDVRNAGNADALAAPATPDNVQLPMLLAVVALAGVTAALVRTWVLRRA
nr:hypothetical protein [Amycolatopsis marina]